LHFSSISLISFNCFFCFIVIFYQNVREI
jgi:hypothetical protein